MSRPTVVRLALVSTLGIMLVADVAFAQKASEAASVSQTVDGAKLTVEYSRPRARGRTGIFGTTVKWGRTWTPGANNSTTLAVTKDVVIEGVAVPKGKYSVWIKVVEGPWEVLLDRDTTRWHTQPPKAADSVLRIPVKRETRPFLDVLTWSFPEVGTDGTTLVMQWDTVAVPLHVTVGDAPSRATAPDAARRVVGRYDLRWTPESGVTADDSAHAAGDTTKRKPVPMRNSFTIRHEGGELRAVMDPPLNRTMPGFTDWLLVPAKEGDAYYIGRLLNGQVMSIDRDMTLRFDVAGGRARGFELRSTPDKLMAKATRVQEKK
jgi:Protein of unknown function (DUF2911)